jgi:Tfp pilus assembly protein PilO
MRFIIPIILIGVAITGFMMFISPLYSQIQTLNIKAASYNEALSNSIALEKERDKLTTKYSTIDPENLKKLSVLLPDSVDNIRLILEIEKIASPYGMNLKDVKYSSNTNASTPQPGQEKLTKSIETNKDYGDWDLEFSTTGSYFNFVNFLKDLEHNLRIVDISSIDFSSSTGGLTLNPLSNDTYKYSLKIKTYWLKN